MGQTPRDASERMQILHAFDRCFSAGSAKRPQAQTTSGNVPTEGDSFGR